MKIPCIVCKKLVKARTQKAIALVCQECNKGDIDNIIKKLTYKDVEKLIPKVTEGGKAVNEYGEVIE